MSALNGTPDFGIKAGDIARIRFMASQGSTTAIDPWFVAREMDVPEGEVRSLLAHISRERRHEAEGERSGLRCQRVREILDVSFRLFTVIEKPPSMTRCGCPVQRRREFGVGRLG